jgi:hypothetical protein
MMGLQHDAHVSGLAETRLARAALRLPCSGVLSLKTEVASCRANLRETGDRGFEALQLLRD